MYLKFWGVRGSTPTPEERCLRHGGNTSCLEIGSGDASERLIVDCGSGLRPLGLALAGVSRLHVVLTHFHWDHIQGLPFFAPLFDAGCEITFYAAASAEAIRERLAVQMSAPFFPVDLDAVPARLSFQQIAHGVEFIAAGFAVMPFALRHPQGATGYRVAGDAGVVVHASDHECGDAAIDEGLRHAALGADVLVMDAQYTPEEYAERTGWGHSSYAACASLAAAAGVKRLVLFHHDPLHDDEFLDRMGAAARELFAPTTMAREGEVLLVRAE